VGRAINSLVTTLMLSMLLAAQLLAPVPQPPSSYATPALRDLVERASGRNRAAPSDLDAYRAAVESELAVLTRRATGDETVVSVEQAHNEIHWQRSGEFTQHVTGYRGKLSGPSISSLAVLNKAWAIPTLYGNRLSLFFGQDPESGRLRENGEPPSNRTVLAVHPFAPGRDLVYDFTGGDTVAVIKTGERAVTVVRVFVEPKGEQAAWPVVVFRGEINLDAEMGEIVRMRGQFVTLARNGPQRQRAIVVPVSIQAYVDLESVLVDGRYWLPLQQRIEQHVNIGGLAEGRTVFRVVSRFGGHRVLESSGGDVSLLMEDGTEAVHLAAYDTPPTLRVHRLTMASADSLGRPRAWLRPLGEATANLRGDDFADVGVEVWGAGRPAVTWRAQRLADLLHFNRVEGWTTGAAISANTGPVELRANAGWAWTEQTVRGRIEAIRANESWTAGVRLGRTLDITNDFSAPYDSGGSFIEALGGVDRYDYVDRRAATAWIRMNDQTRTRFLSLELGAGSDRDAQARLTRGLWEPEAPFLPNRGVDAGSYARATAQVDWNPAVNADPMVPGVGMSARYEVGIGQLDWQRVTARLITRKDAGAFMFGARVDAGALFSSNAPSQQLFEVGGEPSMPGFGYKEFAGDLAITTQWRVGYRLPVMRSPLRVMGCTCFPAPAPALAVTLHGARVSASSPATMASIARLGSVDDQVGAEPSEPGTATPVAWPSAGWRGSTEVALRFFGGAMTLGLVRVNEPSAPWLGRFTLGSSW
jgi:hypothetical protein